MIRSLYEPPIDYDVHDEGEIQFCGNKKAIISAKKAHPSTPCSHKKAKEKRSLLTSNLENEKKKTLL